jgi:hypothetical protein
MLCGADQTKFAIASLSLTSQKQASYKVAAVFKLVYA